MLTAEAGRFAWFDTDGDVAPERPAIIVLPSGPGFSHRTLRPWLRDVANQARLIYVELPGVGRGSLDPKQDFGFEAYVADLEHVRLANGGMPIAFLAHGWGAALAVEYARQHPDAVTSLILISPIRMFGSAGQDADAQKRMVEGVDPTLFARYHADVWPFFNAAMRGETSWDYVESLPWWGEMALTQFATPPPPLWKEALEGEIWRLRAYAAYKGAAMLDPGSAMAAYDLAERVAGLPADLKILVISSEHDANYVAKSSLHAAPVAAAHPGAQLVRLDNAGHYPFVERPADFARILTGFLES